LADNSIYGIGAGTAGIFIAVLSALGITKRVSRLEETAITKITCDKCNDRLKSDLKHGHDRFDKIEQKLDRVDRNVAELKETVIGVIARRDG
jgi:hypothetical protein